MRSAGMQQGLDMRSSVCNCVLRGIFRDCLAHYWACKDTTFPRASLSRSQSTGRKTSWSLKNEEYIVDFCNLSRRALVTNPLGLQIFNLHCIQELEWKACTSKMGINRGEFYHELYRTEQQLGRVYGETKPFPLYPLDEYFNGARIPVKRSVSREEESARKYLFRGFVADNALAEEPKTLRFPIRAATCGTAPVTARASTTSNAGIATNQGDDLERLAA